VGEGAREPEETEMSRFAVALLTGCLFALVLLAAVQSSESSPSQPEANQSVATNVPHEQANPVPSRAYRPESTRADLVMAAVTTVYVFVAIFQWLAIKRQADAAHDALTKLERPWIVMLPSGAGVEPYIHVVGKPPEPTLTFTISLSNAGKSPAWLTGGYSKVYRIKLSDLPSIPDYGKIPPYTRTPAVPGREWKETLRIDLSAAEYDAFLARTLDIVLFGFVSYVDAFDEKHESRFCVLYEPPAVRSLSLRSSFGGPEAYNRYT
jgi:hypothetical protein